MKRHRRPVEPAGGERPLWRTVVLMYGCLAFLVAFVIALAFVIADFVSGNAY